jgi:hypothetical protein
MCLGENKRFSPFGPGDVDERAGASPSLVAGFHARSICIKAMDDESRLFFVMIRYRLIVFRPAGFM